MTPLLVFVLAALAFATVISLYRVLRGPTVFDRLTGVGLLGTKTILLLLTMGAATGQLDAFLDISLSYGLISFLGFLALAKYFEGRNGERERP